MITNKKIYFIALVLLNFSPAEVFSQPGKLDLSFGTGGKVTSDIGNYSDAANAIAIQVDGKIITAGVSSTATSGNIALTRYFTDGTPDSTFDADGIVITGIPGISTSANSILIQPDGKIVIGGNSFVTNSDFLIARFNSDGSPDTTFDSDGIAITALSTGNEYCQSLALQQDGKIVAAGRIDNGSNFDFVTVRYNPNGSIDTAFNSVNASGIVITPFGPDQDRANSVQIQSDGKIVVSGYSLFGTDYKIAVVRYLSNGDPDSTFGTNGKASIGITTHDFYGVSSLIQPDGKIVIAGSDIVNSNSDFAAVRFFPDGSMDTTFDQDGIVSTAIGTGDDQGISVAVQLDGKIIVAGNTANVLPDQDFALVRYNPDGSIDSTFDFDGKVTTYFGSSTDICAGMALQSDEKIVLAGKALNTLTTYNEIALARYNNDPVGVHELTSKTGSVRIIPNPFTGKFYLKGIGEHGRIYLYDINGKEIENIISGGNEMLYDALNLSPGVYFLRYDDGKKITVEKLVKQAE